MNRDRRGSEELEPRLDQDQEDYVSIDANSDVPQFHGSLPKFHDLTPRQHEQPRTSTDDISITRNSSRPEKDAWQQQTSVTLPRLRSPPTIPERVDLVDRHKPAPNGFGETAGSSSPFGATPDAPNGVVKRRTPVPTPRKKASSFAECSFESGLSPRIRPSSYTSGEESVNRHEHEVTKRASEPEAHQVAMIRASPVGAEINTTFMPLKEPSDGSESSDDTIELAPPMFSAEAHSASQAFNNPIYGVSSIPPSGPTVTQPQKGSYDHPRVLQSEYQVPVSRHDPKLNSDPHSTVPQHGAVEELLTFDSNYHVYEKPSEHVYASVESRSRPRDQVATDVTYEIPSVPSGAVTQHDDETPQSVTYDVPRAQSGTASRRVARSSKPLPPPPLPQKDIFSRNPIKGEIRLPEPLLPVPASPTSPTASTGSPFASGCQPWSTITSSVTREAEVTSVAEEIYDEPFVLPPAPEIPEETLHQPPPGSTLGDTSCLDLDRNFNDLTMGFLEAHSVDVNAPSTAERQYPQASVSFAAGGDENGGELSLGEEQKRCIGEVRSVWPSAAADWCCAALIECDGDSARVLKMAKVEQVHSVTNREKGHCEFTLGHCNWDLDRAVNYLFENP